MTIAGLLALLISKSNPLPWLKRLREHLTMLLLEPSFMETQSSLTAYLNYPNGRHRQPHVVVYKRRSDGEMVLVYQSLGQVGEKPSEIMTQALRTAEALERLSESLTKYQVMEDDKDL